jgi:hypothetical protein
VRKTAMDIEQILRDKRESEVETTSALDFADPQKQMMSE